jgi:hypothetical protein
MLTMTQKMISLENYQQVESTWCPRIIRLNFLGYLHQHEESAVKKLRAPKLNNLLG